MPNTPKVTPPTSPSQVFGSHARDDMLSTSPKKYGSSVTPKKKGPAETGPLPEAVPSGPSGYAMSSEIINEFISDAKASVLKMEDSLVLANQLIHCHTTFHEGLSEMAAGASKAMDAVLKRDSLYTSVVGSSSDQRL